MVWTVYVSCRTCGHICNWKNECLHITPCHETFKWKGFPTKSFVVNQSSPCKNGLGWKDKSCCFVLHVKRVVERWKSKSEDAHTDQHVLRVNVWGDKEKWKVEGYWGQDLGARENSHFLLTSVCTLAPSPSPSCSRPNGGRVGCIQCLLCVLGAVGGCRVAKGGIMYGCLMAKRI